MTFLLNIAIFFIIKCLLELVIYNTIYNMHLENRYGELLFHDEFWVLKLIKRKRGPFEGPSFCTPKKVPFLNCFSDSTVLWNFWHNNCKGREKA